MTLARILFIGAAAAGVMATSAEAADLYRAPPSSPVAAFYDDPMGFAYEGFYAGVLGGGVVAGGLAGTVGGVAGVNFALSDTFYLGGEIQGSAWFAGGGFVGFDVLGLARVGALLTDNTVVYAAAGGGTLNGATPIYALGGGVEFGLADSIGLRAEGLAFGPWGGAPAGGKIQAGLIFHIN